jgi:hypothetical protein
MTDKVRENRLRRVASRQGMTLQRSRRRDERACDHGLYRLVDTVTNVVVAGSGAFNFTMTLDDVEAWLNSDDRA